MSRDQLHAHDGPLRRFDDSSSMSSVSSGTTTTTSSSMSSACGDLVGQLPIAAKESARNASKSGLGRSSRDSTTSNGSPASSSHTVIKCSPRRANVKKADSCMQTESASAIGASNNGASSGGNASSNSSIYTWKKYLHEHALKGDRGSSPGHNGSPAKIAVVSSVQSSDEGRRSSDSGSRKSSQRDSSKSNALYSNGSGRAVAVIRANSATTGRSVGNKSHGSPGGSGHRGKDVKSAQGRPFPSEIYSDTECSLKSYPFCLTSQVLQASQRESYAEGGHARDRLSGIYGQVYSPWLQRQQQQSNIAFPRNALTEAESMESLASLSQLGRASVAGKPSDMQINGSQKSSLPLMTGRKPRIHASSGHPGNGSRHGLRKMKENENGEIFSSNLSLLSNTSAAMSPADDRHSQEVRKLRRELEASNEKVVTLTSQLNTNAHMVAAFEQSLLAMTARLQQQTVLSEHKDSELKMLKMLVEELNEYRRGNGREDNAKRNHAAQKKEKQMKKGQLIRRHTFASSADELKAPISRHKSSDEILADDERKLKVAKKNGANSSKDGLDCNSENGSLKSGGWFRSSLTRAFRKSNSKPRGRGSQSESETLHSDLEESSSLPSSPVMAIKMAKERSKSKIFNASDSDLKANQVENGQNDDVIVESLQKQLAEKDRQLTDLRLESLTTAHQLDSLSDTLAELRHEISSLKQENEKLQNLLAPKSLTSSRSSLLSMSTNGQGNNSSNAEQIVSGKAQYAM